MLINFLCCVLMVQIRRFITYNNAAATRGYQQSAHFQFSWLRTWTSGDGSLDVIVSITSKDFFAPRMFKRKKKKPTFVRLPTEQLCIATLRARATQSLLTDSSPPFANFPFIRFKIFKVVCKCDSAKIIEKERDDKARGITEAVLAYIRSLPYMNVNRDEGRFHLYDDFLDAGARN